MLKTSIEVIIEYISESKRMTQGAETEFQRLKRAASESRKTITTKSPNQFKKKKKKKRKMPLFMLVTNKT